jgi:hypothetical protein
MEYAIQVHLYLTEFIGGSGEGKTKFEDLLQAAEVMLPNTPPPTLGTIVPMSMENIDRIYLHIFNNLRRNSVSLTLSFWKEFFTGTLNAGDSVRSEKEKAAFLSLLLAISRSKDENDFLIPSVFHRCSVDIGTSLPNNVLTFLHSNVVSTSFQEATNPNLPINYTIPPLIYVVSGVPSSLAGWVCFSNAIAINAIYFNTASLKLYPERLAEMVLANVIAHECQHGILRSQTNDFNLHTPDLPLPALAPDVLGDEASLRFEYMLWQGIPQWHAPVDEYEADILARDIFELLQQGSSFSDSATIKNRLRTKVGFDHFVRTSDTSTSKFCTRFAR